LYYVDNHQVNDCDKTSYSYYPSNEKNDSWKVDCGNINDFILSTFEKDGDWTMGGNYDNIFKIKTKWNSSVFIVSTYLNDGYILQKLYNAFQYLISIVQESKDYKRPDKDDPFAPGNFDQIDIKSINNEPSINTCSVPIKVERNLNVIELKIGNLENSFILDSGSSDVSISTELEQQLLLSGYLSDKDYLANGLYKLADGSIKLCKRILLRSIIICNFKVFNTIASVSGEESPLLLGKSFLNKFKKWTIDNSTSNLYLEK
jgi:hypothetical protein